MNYRWRYAEDDYCCKKFVETYIVGKQDFPYQTLAYNIKLKFDNLTEETITIKISNIVYIANCLKIKHTCTISPLCNFSKQSLITFVQQLIAKNIYVDKSLVSQLIKERFKI